MGNAFWLVLERHNIHPPRAAVLCPRLQQKKSPRHLKKGSGEILVLEIGLLFYFDDLFDDFNLMLATMFCAVVHLMGNKVHLAIVAG